MAIFQFHMQLIKRSEGRSVVAAAAYRSASKIANNYTGTIEDYTKKGWIEYNEVMLPEHAPEKFKDRSVLWNSVEENEKGRNARLAREIEVALPMELSMEENIELIRDFVQSTFTDDGMAADVNIHNPPVTDSAHCPIDINGNRTTNKADMVFRNPHAHILLTVRPLEEDGSWAAKTQKEYVCKRGEETKAFTAEEFRQAKAEGWEKQYQYWVGRKKVWMTPSEAFTQNLVRVSKDPKATPYGRREVRAERWNSPDSLIQYRKAWEEHVNQALKKAGRPERVDCRSYTEQGADTISGIHLGSHASRQKDSDRYQINEEIKALNEKNRGIRKTLDSLEAQIKEKSERVYEELAETLGRLEADIVSAKYSVEMLQEQVHQVTESRERLEGSVKRVRTARDTMKEKDRISQANIARFRKELEGKFPAWSSRPAELAQAIQAEQDSIRFRRERLSRILEEEGFADIPDFMQESQILEQMKREEERLTQGISAAQAQVEEYTSRYEELCKRIPTDSEQFQKFTSRKDSYSQQYRDKTADRIRHKSGNAHVKKFLRIAKETNYSLHHAYYLAGRTAYLMKQMQDLAEEQDGRRRR